MHQQNDFDAYPDLDSFIDAIILNDTNINTRLVFPMKIKHMNGELFFDKFINKKELMTDDKLIILFKNSDIFRDEFIQKLNQIYDMDDLSKIINYFEENGFDDFIIPKSTGNISLYVVNYLILYKNLPVDLFHRFYVDGMFINSGLDSHRILIEIFNNIFDKKPDIVEYINSKIQTNIKEFMLNISTNVLFYFMDSSYDLIIDSNFVTNFWDYRMRHIICPDKFSIYIKKIIENMDINGVAEDLILTALSSRSHSSENLKILSNYIDLNYYLINNIDEINKKFRKSPEEYHLTDVITNLCPDIPVENLGKCLEIHRDFL